MESRQGSIWSAAPSGIICLVPEYIIGIGIVESWHNPHSGACTWGGKSYHSEESQVEAYETAPAPAPAKQYCIKGSMVEINATPKDPEDSMVVAFTIFLLPQLNPGRWQ